MHGAPKAWAQEDVVAFLCENSWDSPQVITRRRSWTKGAPPEWLFKAFAPSAAPTDELFSYADESSYLTVAPEGPRPKKPVKTTPVSGLKKRWVDKPSQMQPCAPTQLDDDDNLLDTSDEEPVESPSEVQPRRVSRPRKRHRRGPARVHVTRSKAPESPALRMDQEIRMRCCLGTRQAGLSKRPEVMETAASEPVLWLWRPRRARF